MHEFRTSKHFERLLKTLSKKDKQLYVQLLDKMQSIVHQESLDHYKHLRHALKPYKRVHVGSFVLLFRYNDNCIYFEDFAHHDVIYKRKR